MRKGIVIVASAALLAPVLSFGGGFWNPTPLDYKVAIIDDANAPIKITKLELKYDEKGFGLAGFGKESGLFELYTKAKYENVSGKEIVAASLGGVVFDYFDDHLYNIACHAIEKIEPGKGKEGTWSFNFEDDFSTYAIVLYVEAVRFTDETVWKADDEYVLSEVNKIRGTSYAVDILR
ncbi:MAG: hypothetical protein JSU81_01490 [Candidatus Coatesbacteria bacterium]|nr:MAG: hypothetical protein JSU81_01490 [Candidatus Coatesbacteria bacterium]